MRQQPINLIGGFYADESRHWSVQDTCNWLPVVAEQQGTLTPAKLATPPGLRPYQQIGTGPIRGMHDCEGQRFVVSGRTLYRITNTGVGIPLGTVPGVGRVSISHNQFGGGNQVLVCNGAPGGGYVYDTRAQTFERITDPGFPGSLQTAYIDSYLLGVEPAGRFWFHSNLADATDYNTLDRYEAEAAPDRIVGLAVSQFEVIVFGERTAEFYGNAGGATGTFQSKRAVIDRGCASRHTICNLDNSVFWLGDDGIVYRLEGYAARRVSTVPLERALAGLRWSDAFAFAWEDKGHKVYYLTFPDGQTWGYDVVCGLWHRRESYGLSRWRLNDAVRWGNAWFGGDFQNGRIWQLDWDYPAEGDQPMVSERTSPVMSDSQSAFIASSVELIMGVGQQSVEITGEFPEQPPRPEISGQAPDGVKGRQYSYTYTAIGGTGAITFSVLDAPAWASINATTGEINFRPVDAGSYVFRVRATDSKGMWAELTDTIVIERQVMAIATPLYTYNARNGVVADALPVNADGSVASGTVSVTPNAQYMAISTATTPNMQVRELNDDGTQYLAGPSLTPAPAGIGQDARFSNDGTMLAVATYTSGVTGIVSIYAVGADEFTLITSATLPAIVQSLGWAPDGKAIAIGIEPHAAGAYFAILRFDGETLGAPIYTSALSDGATVKSIRWDGRYVAGASSTYTNIWEWKGGALKHIVRVGVINQASRFAWLDGGFALCGSTVSLGQELSTYGFNGSSVTGPFTVDIQPDWTSIGSIGVSSDRKYLAIGRTGASTQALFLYRVDGITLTAYEEQPVTLFADAQSLVWTPSGI